MMVGDKVILRPWEKSDIQSWMRWFNDPEVTIYLGNAYPFLTLEQEERFYQQRQEDSESKHNYSILCKEDGVVVGNCGLRDVNLKDRSAEVGIVIGEKAYWGRGLGREALRMVQEIVFDGLGLNRLYLTHADFNERGHRCYLAAGFVEEGRLRQARYVRGRFCDSIVMGVLADEYRARRQMSARE